MKKHLILLACAAFLGQAVQAQEYIGDQHLKGETLKDVSIMGSAQLTDIKADNLSILGTLEFDNLTVAKEVNIAGPVEKSKKGKFGTLNVVGTFEASDVTTETFVAAGAVSITGLSVTGETTVAGVLKVMDPKDPKMTENKLKNLTVAAEETSLEATNVEGNILVKKLSGWLNGDKKQVLKLVGKTTVKGTITFESGKGTIEQGAEAKIEGKVTGATVEKK